MTFLGADVFNDAFDATFSAYVKADGQALTDAEKIALREYLRSANFESSLDDALQSNRALVEGDRPIYTFWSAGTQPDALAFTEFWEVPGTQY